MALNAKLSYQTNNVIVVNQTQGRLTSASPRITLKNQVSEINSIEDLPDVTTPDVSEGALLQYNLTNDRYEIKPLDLRNGTIDAGTF